MMHEGSKLRVGIREIDLLVFDEVEMLHQLQVRMFSVFGFKPSPGLGSGLLFDLIPDPNIEGSVKNSNCLEIVIFPSGKPSVIQIQGVVVPLNLDIVLCPHGVETLSYICCSSSSDACRGSWCCQQLRFSGHSSGPVGYIIDFSHHEDTNHFLRPALKVPSIEARGVGDKQSGGFVGGHVDRVS